MSDRERWIVYPLLFLALGSSLRPRLTGQMELAKLECQSLQCRSIEVHSLLVDQIGSEKVPVQSASILHLGTEMLNGGLPLVIRVPVTPGHKPGTEKSAPQEAPQQPEEGTELH